MKDLNKQIGAKLKEAREVAGLSLREVASIVGKNHSTIHSYETGRNAINVDVMRDICNVYEVNYLDILQEIYYKEKLKEG